MELLNQALKLLNQLPSQIKQSTLLSLYPEYKQNVCKIDAVFAEQIEAINKFMNRDNIILTFDFLNNQINQLLSQQTQQSTSDVTTKCRSIMTLLINTPASPHQAFKELLVHQEFPKFCPFASFQPYIQLDKNLLIQPSQELDLQNFSSNWNGKHPFEQIITELPRNTNQLKELIPNDDVINNAIFYIETNSQLLLEYINSANISQSNKPPSSLILPLQNISALDQFQIIQKVQPALKSTAQKALLATSKLILITTNEELASTCEQLLQFPILALDVEFSPFHSYLGNTSLLQLTTPSGDDYIFDLLAYQDFTPLRKLFSNPYSLKIIHGCSNDIYWLQRDFRVFLVNVFDTAELAILSRQRAKLQHLLAKYHVFIDKNEQCSDWALRPLKTTQIEYARQDSHWLIGLSWEMQDLINRAFSKRMVDLELLSASNRIDLVEGQAIRPIKSASSKSQLENSLNELWHDVYCRFYDLPVAQGTEKCVQDDEITQIISDWMQKCNNDGQFNASNLKSKHPIKCEICVQKIEILSVFNHFGHLNCKFETIRPSLLNDITDQQQKIQLIE
ncbi:Exosome 3'-5' exoribonuclease complex, subunit Rrp6p [Spironucleus salmonicida]|uniref:Exosome 3'-5' exoribonuclease complex, subunit Rrp6p n=1 Tax=Spironucleus salmonicida TaxID=348837 RepID=V6LXT0_9EUKA|nr:Exosome 3'-5' exoribonuclease complex, subunit Rrp6p [Spironucleus salmonicida]|eukprot:EST48521.1 Exosome 3'-5' exoribonuclease complex, subunit Rrp6p [Spironucleus salmonicida]